MTSNLKAHGIDPKSGFLGVSIGTPYYSRDRINAYLAWAEFNLEKFAFLVGDEIFALTNSVFKKISMEEANKRATNRRDEICTMLQNSISARGQAVKIFCWSDLRQIQNYEQYLDALRIDFASDSIFKADVRAQVWKNLGTRLAVTGCPVDPTIDNTASKPLDEYVLREIAGLITISEHTDYTVELYPGDDLDIIKYCYARKYSNIGALIPREPKREFLSLQVNA